MYSHLFIVKVSSSNWLLNKKIKGKIQCQILLFIDYKALLNFFVAKLPLSFDQDVLKTSLFYLMSFRTHVECQQNVPFCAAFIQA